MTPLEVLREELEQQIGRFDEESKRHKDLYRRLRYLAFALTALSAVLAGISAAGIGETRWISLAIVAVTSLGGVATSIEGLRKPAELWIHERTTLYALKDLLREVEFHAAERIDPRRLAGQFERLQGILGSSSDKWSRFVKGGTEEPPEGPGPALVEGGP